MTGIRKYSRIPFVADAIIETGTERLQVHILDISLKGALVALEGEASPPASEPYTLCIRLADDNAICMQAVTRNRDADRLGCEWTGIDIESMTSLRRLLELNLANCELIERELHQLQHP
ncbi:MAG: PilZ domain-containing protein [Halothiobacillaceae bacterium]|jgi:hypothetical protein